MGTAKRLRIAELERQRLERLAAGVADDMQLPEGKTCKDCKHIERCQAMFGVTGTETLCDWSPSKFKPKEEPKPAINEDVKG